MKTMHNASAWLTALAVSMLAVGCADGPTGGGDSIDEEGIIPSGPLVALSSSGGGSSCVTVNFDAGSGFPLSYTEGDIIVTSQQTHLHFANFPGALLNHSGCCSTPYEFKRTDGAPFTVVSLDVVQASGTGDFTSSSSAVLARNSVGPLTFPAAGWTGIISFLWSEPSGFGTIDNLVICPGNEPPEFVSPPTPADGDAFSVLANHEITIDVEASDPDAGQTVTLTATMDPTPFTAFSFTETVVDETTTGAFSWTPTVGDLFGTPLVSRTYTVVFTATDNLGASAPDVSVTIEVLPDPCEGLDDCNAEIIDEDGGTTAIEEDDKAVGGLNLGADEGRGDVIVAARFDDDCHAFLIGTLGRCLELTATSVNPGEPVEIQGVVALCFDEVTLPDDPTLFSIFGFARNDVPPATEELPSVQNVDLGEELPQDFLDCTGFSFPLASASANPLIRFASAVVNRVKRWLAPPPLMATVTLRDLSFGRGTSGPIFHWAQRAIDILPEIDPNVIVCPDGKAGPPAQLPVALLSVDLDGDGVFDPEDFDATDVDHTTVKFGPFGTPEVGWATEAHVHKKKGAKRHEEDVNEDGLTDLVFHFEFDETGLVCGTHTFANLKGEFGAGPNDGDTFETGDFIVLENGG